MDGLDLILFWLWLGMLALGFYGGVIYFRDKRKGKCVTPQNYLNAWGRLFETMIDNASKK